METLRKKKNQKTRIFRIKIPGVSYFPTNLRCLSLCVHGPSQVQALLHVGSVIQQPCCALRCILKSFFRSVPTAGAWLSSTRLGSTVSFILPAAA